ncbi:unnamed protein product [Linum tenue]|uniref:F-box associated domain-containing protein n=1 Tax=Linum tenue TaxID=586396 RepID=A0AAV0JU10_9ROSI|nr:unnamed protein product [Linum tenue]
MAFNWSTGRFPARNVASCKGKLYWRNMNRQVVVFNPLRQCSLVVLDISRFFVERLMYCDVWASQGVLHLIIIEHQGTVRSNDVLCVWRLDAGGVEEWRRLYRVSLKDMLSEVQGMEMKRVLGMHPNKPEIVFLEFVHIDGNTRVLSCNLQKQELQFFTEYRSASLDFLHWNVFQPILRWPTRIPRYEDLRGGFDGSSSFWVQKSNKSTAARSEVGSFLQRLQL